MTPKASPPESANGAPANNYVLIALLVAVAVVHSSSLVGAYVFDDKTVVNDEAFYDFWKFDWWSSKTLRRPIGRTLFAIQFEFLGSSARVSHLVNVAIHLVAVAGMFQLLRLVLTHQFAQWSESWRRWVAAAATTIWALHPITTTVVTYSIQRFESLAAVGMIWSVYFWIRAYSNSLGATPGEVRVSASPNWFYWTLSLAAACFAFGSKQTSAGIPFVLILADRAVLRDSWKASVKHWFGPSLLLIPLALGASFIVPALFRSSPTKTVGFQLEGIDTLSYICSQPFVFLRYLKLTVLPTDLVLDYGWIPSHFQGWLWLGAVIWLAVFGALWVAWTRRPLIAWLASWALMILATTSLLPTQDIIYEHRYYLPSGMLIAAVVVAVAKLPRVMQSGEKPMLAVVAVICVLLAFGTVMRNLDYVSALRLAQVDAQRQPENPRALYRVAAFDDDSSQAQLETALRRAIQMSEERGYWYAGTDYKWRRELADLLYLTGRPTEAAPWYVEALKENHNPLQEAEVIMSLAIIASINGENDTADKLFKKGIAMETEVTDQLEQAYQTHMRRLSQQSDQAQ
ncbi:MAG: hypothetical protein AAFU85_09405 [Planctomycetota bacterium]